MNLNEAAIKALVAPTGGNRVTFFADAVVQGKSVPAGFGVRVTAAGVKSFVLDYRHRGRQHRVTIGRWPTWSALKAVTEARMLRQRIDLGENPMDAKKPAPAAVTVARVLDDYLAASADLRTIERYRACFDRLAKPRIGDVPIRELKRSGIAGMLTAIAAENGKPTAHHVLGTVRAALNWYAGQDDDFVPPFAPGMGKRLKPKARERVLSDDELGSVWSALDQLTQHRTIVPVVKLLLLTGQRRDEVAAMRWSEIESDVWVIPADRYKSKRAHFVPLTGAALAVLQTQTHRNDTDLTFPSARIVTPWASYSKGKTALDKLAQIAPWRLHDLRRTAKTLMQRAGVRPDISERVLGHVIAGVEGTYDRYSYADEKREALEKLAVLVTQIAGASS